MEKWLYVIVGLTFLSGVLGNGPPLLLDRRTAVLVVDRRRILGARAARLPGDGGLRLQHSAALGSWTPQHAGASLDDRLGDLLDARRRHPRTRAHLAAGESLDTWHAHHHHARPHGVLRRLRDDHARHDHLCAAGADRHAGRGAADQARDRRLLADGRWHARNDDGAGGGGHHANLPRAHHGLRLPRDPAEDPGPLLDVARQPRSCSRSAWSPSSGTSPRAGPPWAPARAKA